MTLKPDPAGARKLLMATRMAKRHLPKHLPPLIYLTDPDRSDDPVEVTSRLPQGSAVIFRHFGLSNRLSLARQLRQATFKRHTKLIISNDPELACEVRADGVHWPEAYIQKAKYWRARFSLMTTSAHSRAALSSASVSFVDAALLSTVFRSDSPSSKVPIGALRFRHIAYGSKTPVYALGGIHAENANRIASAGGIASISGIQESFSPKT